MKYQFREAPPKAGQAGIIHVLPLLVIIAAVGIISFLLISSTLPLNGLFGILNPKPKSHAATSVTVTGVSVDNSSAKIYYQPVPGAKDYRVYDVTNPSNVKYAGLAHLMPPGNCPGQFCLQHFAMQADGVTPIFPYQLVNGVNTQPQELNLPSVEIEYNSLGDNLPHTLVVEAVDQLGPVPKDNLYTGGENVPMVSPLPAGAMLGSNKGPTPDGKISTNGQGPFTNNPQVIAQSQPFVVQANPNLKAIPTKPDAVSTFYDTFENSEGSTLKQLSRNDGGDSFGNLGAMEYTMNAGTSKAWDIHYRDSDNIDSMPFITSDHFMDVMFDGATPNTSAPTHTIYGSMSMSPSGQTVDLTQGKVLHMTMEVDFHQSNRRWLDLNLSPASDPIQNWGGGGEGKGLNNSDQTLFLELKGGHCTLDIYNGPVSATNNNAIGTAGDLAKSPTDPNKYGSRLWGQAGSSGGAPIMCYSPYNQNIFSANGLGLDDRSRIDFYISQTHAALFIDGQLSVQSVIPAGSFNWSNVPLKAYFSHYLYHSDAEEGELTSFYCYPQNSYWFNDPVNGTTSTQTSCGGTYPPGFGFRYSDERHWDNMGFEVLPLSDVPAGNDFSTFASLVQPLPTQAPQFVTGSITPTPSPSGIAQTFNTILNGANNVPSITSNGIGDATLVLSADQTMATVRMNYSGLTSNASMAHIHGPATTAQTVGILFPLTIGTGTSASNVSTMIMNITSQQVADLKNGLWYINVHTINNPGGEIRGQLTSHTSTPTPSSPACQGADIDKNGKVDIFDYNILIGNFNKLGSGIQGDIDNSGKVNIFDYNILLGNFGKTGC